MSGRIAVILFLVGVLSVLGGALIGPVPLAPGEVLSALGLGSQADEALRLIVVDIRLSRSVLAWLVGAGLGASGAVLQGLLRNPLADPFTLGVSSGAAFGVALTVYLGLGTTLFGALGVLTPAAVIGALGTLGLVLVLARMAGGLRRETMILAGIVTATFLAALISLIKALDEESVTAIVFWIMGSLQGRGWAHVFLYLPWWVVGMILVWRLGLELDLLNLGSGQAQQMGVDAERSRLWLLLGAGILAGAGVAVSGVIGFVGLVVPHFVRLFQGREHRPLILSSALAGGVLLLWSDVAARTLLPRGGELPVGVVTALVGGPAFWAILCRRMGRE
ncbi:MAG: iron ABC transporter permease [Deltaproteobacteria bacterium]|nr:iron ABC transporter permease [Deltaproteobacteria bacterium]